VRHASYYETVMAARKWIAQHGHFPTQHEWERAALGRPSTRTIRRRWGWEELMADAAGGLGPAAAAARARRRELLMALRQAREQLGRWPKPSEWEVRGDGRVTRRSVERAFGTWERAIRAADRLRV
jgi:hypothetical protein